MDIFGVERSERDIRKEQNGFGENEVNLRQSLGALAEASLPIRQMRDEENPEKSCHWRHQTPLFPNSPGAHQVREGGGY